MARIKYSGLIDEINGSIGGTTFQRNRYGFTIKRKPAGKKTGTTSQLVRRNSLFRIQQGWIGLSDPARSSWNAYASTFPAPTRLNPNAFLNGVNLFEKYNLLRAVGGVAILTDPSGPQETLSFDEFTIKLNVGSLDMVSNINVSGSNWIFLLFLSLSLRATTALSKSKTRFVFTAVVQEDISAAINTEYLNIFGTIPAVGDFLQFRRVYLHTQNGQIFDEGVRQVEVLAP